MLCAVRRVNTFIDHLSAQQTTYTLTWPLEHGSLAVHPTDHKEGGLVMYVGCMLEKGEEVEKRASQPYICVVIMY